MSDLRYPIGPFVEPTSDTAALRARHLDELESGPAELRRAVAGLDDTQLDTPYRAGGWTVRQVVHHVPDSHMNAYIRHKLVVTEDGPTIKPYDEQAWSALGEGSTGGIAVSLDLLAALHERWLRFLRSLPDSAFRRIFHHPAIVGPVSLDTSVAMYAWHTRHHVAHIDALRHRAGW